MGTGPQFVELSSLVSEKPRNGLYKGKEFQGEGNRWIKMGEVFKNDFFSDQQTELLTVTASEVDRFSCKAGDLLFGRTSLTLEGVGDCLLVGDLIDKPIFESNLFRVRFNKKRADPLFYYYYFKSGLGKQLIQKIAKQTAATSITATDLIAQFVPFYPLNTQQKIANVIHQFDQKIELNRQINETLEAMAQALFKSWFVDFDPVIDNALAAGNSIPDVFAERAKLRAAAKKPENQSTSATAVNDSSNYQHLFPAEFEFTEEMGWIPLGWEVSPLGSHITVKRGGSPRPIHDYLVEEGLPWVKISDATASSSRFLSETKQFIKPEGLKKTTLLEKGRLILSNSATPGLPKFLELDACIHDGWLHFPERNVFTELYLYQLFLVIRPQLLMQGNGSVFTNLKTDILKDHILVVPSKTALCVFDQQMEEFHRKIRSIQQQVDCLIKLRGTLLPKLLSGELRIPDAEKLVQEAML